MCIKEIQDEKWTTRKIKEFEMIKEEDKRDRLAIANEKRKRYGLKKLNKEENKRLKERMERKIELAQAKSNYWKWHRGDRKGGNGKEEETEARWQRLKEEITALEEEKDITPMIEE